MSVGTLIREARTARGLSQGEVAGERFSAAYISLIEAGKREPSNEALSFIASRLGGRP